MGFLVGANGGITDKKIDRGKLRAGVEMKATKDAVGKPPTCCFPTTNGRLSM